MLTIFSKPIFRLSVVILVNENILRATPVLSKEVKQRGYARWAQRRPSKVFPPEEMQSPPGSFESEEPHKTESAEPDSFELAPPKAKQKVGKKDKVVDKKKKILSYNGHDYEWITDENDFTFSKLMTLVGNRKMRMKNDLMLLEGKRLNIDALQAGLTPKKLFFTEKTFLDELNIPTHEKIPLYRIPYKTIKLWSKMDSPPGIIGFYGIPKAGDIQTQGTIPVKVLCDNVRDPNNMGSIIRVAASVGCTEVILMKGCTDPWDSKVLRSASGGHFHIPIKTELAWADRKKFLDPSDRVVIADSLEYRKPPFNYNLEQHLYYDVDYLSSDSLVVAIGGETEGLSSEVFTMAGRQGGTRVHIPLSNCMESLNTGCALSVVLFEIKRQYRIGKHSEKKISLPSPPPKDFIVRASKEEAVSDSEKEESFEEVYKDSINSRSGG